MKTAISWTNETWNPVTGCSRVSEGCRNCYAERLSLKHGWTQLPWTAANATENVRLRPERLTQPFKFPPGTMCFVNSMSDLFHELVPDSYIDRVLDTIEALPDIVFQVLTKRSKRLRQWERWPHNLWMGVSVENAQNLHRVEDLRCCGAKLKFVSCEPLLGPLDELDLTNIDWVIVGGESGPNFRKMNMAWARTVRDICRQAGVPFYFKQDSGYRPELRPYLIEPDGSQTVIREYPNALHVKSNLNFSNHR